MRVNENGQYVSDDGFWVWDGAAWIPADGSAAPTSAEAEATQTGEGTADAAAPVTETTHEPLATFEPEATQEYSAVDYASDTTAADTGSYGASSYESRDDSGSLPAEDRVVPHVDNQHPMSPDGRHWWDGEKWIDVSTDATTVHAASLAEETPDSWQPQAAAEPEPEPEPEAAVEAEPVAAQEPVQTERQLSPDGMWEWNGTQWVPADQGAAAPEPEPEPQPEPEPVRAQRQLSPDGHWEWDGTAWVPAQQQAAAAVPAGAHISPDGHWWWDGSQWLPTGN